MNLGKNAGDDDEILVLLIIMRDEIICDVDDEIIYDADDEIISDADDELTSDADDKMSHVMRKPAFAICKQQSCRSACTSLQSDQHLCCSLPR